MTIANLHKLPKEIVQTLCQFGQTVKYQDKCLLHCRGDIKPGLSVVISGLIKVGNYGLNGRYCLTKVLEPGETFGEFTLFSNLPRTHNAESIGISEVLQLSRPEFETACINIPELKDIFLASMSTKLHECLELIDDIRRLPLTVRLAKTLLTISHTRQRNDIEIRQSDLADVVGITVLSCHKALKALSEIGLINLAYGRIFIINSTEFNQWVELNSELKAL